MKNILQFHISLNDSEPQVWRRFLVTDDYRFDRFHQVIQLAMGWQNCHLHEFEIKGDLIGMETGYDDPPDQIDETTRRIDAYDLREGDSFAYNYDFGDSWHHTLTLEKITQGELKVPECLEGEMACPPEDIGGVPIFNEIASAFKDTDLPKDSIFRKFFRSGYDPFLFDLKATNRELKKFGQWHNKHPHNKSTPWHQLE